MERKKIYVAGKVTGESAYNVAYKFGYAASKLRTKGHIVFNPQDYFAPMERGGFNYEDIMGMCFRAIELCDAVFMLHDWYASPGAKREHEFALNLGKEIIYEDAQCWNIGGGNE